MSLHARTLLSIAALAALAACSSDNPLPPTAITGPNSSLNANVTSGLAMRFEHAKVCPSAAPGTARCHSLVRVDGSGQPLVTGTPNGYGPADLLSAYKLASTGGTGQTIAIVDAYDDANAESDLAVYRSQFGLPPCTTANGCFRKVNQTGGTKYPRGDMGWAEEISLDLDMASAICPNCKILLVEGPGGYARSERYLELVRRRRIFRRGQRPGTLQSPWHRHHRQLRRQRLWRRVPGGITVRNRSWRHDSQSGWKHPWLERDGLERRRQRLQCIYQQAELADRRGLLASDRCGRLGGRRSEHRRRGL